MMGQRTGSRCVFDATTIKRTVAFVVNVFRCVDQPCNSCTPRCSWATFVGKYIPVIDRTIVVKRTMCLNVEHMLQLIATAVEIVNINMGNVNLERYWTVEVSLGSFRLSNELSGKRMINFYASFLTR